MKPIVLFLSFILLAMCTIVSAQNNNVLTNKNVLDMVRAGFGEQIIITKINNSVCDFNLELDTMIWLKSKGVTDNVMTSMMNARQLSIADLKSDNPADMHRSGIYYYDSSAVAGEMVRQIDENVISQTKASGAYIYGVPVSSSSIVVDGAQARFIVKNESPEFFFYFENVPNDNTLNNSGFISYNASSPNQFSVINFSTSSSSNQRSVQTSSGVGISDASGISSKYKIQFEYEKLSDGIYRVYFKTPLKSGEYAFIYSGANGYNNKIFDFSVNGGNGGNGNGKKSKGGGINDFLFH